MTLLEKYIEIEKGRVLLTKAVDEHICDLDSGRVLITMHDLHSKPTFSVFYNNEEVEEGSYRGIVVVINDLGDGKDVFQIKKNDNKFSKSKVKKLLDHAKMVFNTEFKQ